MKTLVVVVLLLLSIYWFFDHASPLPLNHESLGLYQHEIHRLVGIVFLMAAVIVQVKWKPAKK